jgi:hypothetical protein
MCEDALLPKILHLGSACWPNFWFSAPTADHSIDLLAEESASQARL